MKAFRHFNACSLADPTGGVMDTLNGQAGTADQIELAAFAKALLRFPVGSCDMMSALAFAYLVEKKGTFPVTRMSLRDADHMFIVIGTGVNLTGDWHQWNSTTAAICDPWADFAGLCNPTAIQTWMQTLDRIMPAPFQPANTFVQSYGVNSRAQWNYRIIP